MASENGVFDIREMLCRKAATLVTGHCCSFISEAPRGAVQASHLSLSRDIVMILFAFSFSVVREHYRCDVCLVLATNMYDPNSCISSHLFVDGHFSK